jgi:hypothetical protein
MMRSMLLFILFFPLAVYAESAYQWTDTEGNLHYSDLPPDMPVEKEKRITLPAPSATPPPANSTGLRPGEVQMLRELEQEAQREQNAHQKAQHKAEEQQQSKEALCAKYTKLMATVKSPNAAKVAARKALAEGDYQAYRELREARDRRALLREYKAQASRYCQP